VSQTVSGNPELATYQTWLKKWEDTQSQKALEYLTQAKQFNTTQHASEALVSLEKARLYSPFASEVYLEKAKAEVQLNNVAEAKKTLQVAENLGLTKTQLDESHTILP
jgi:predicted negative regulator of RcsB-dependent stress response